MEQEFEDCGQEVNTVLIPHQPLKAFNRELDADFDAEESNAVRVRRELRSLQERLSTYYCMGREEREKHRLNILNNLNQLDLYWFETDDFDKAMFRFRCAWMDHLVDETVDQLYKALCENLKDLWSLEYEIGRLLLEDLRKIQESLKNQNTHQNGVNFLVEHFNIKVVHSLQTSHDYCLTSKAELQKLLDNTEYICEELMNRLILDNTMPEYEKALLGNELNNFRKDAKSHIQEVDNYHYELRELVKGITMRKLRGLTKDEYKEKIHSIIAFIEKAEVPLHVFKSVGFDLKRIKEVSAPAVDVQPTRTGVEEKDYEDE